MPWKSKAMLDWKSFSKAVRVFRAEKGVSLRAAVDEISLTDHTILMRVERGLPCSAENFLAICSWINQDPLLFLKQTRSLQGG